MTIIEMFKQSAILTVLGMTIVYAFLWLMIVCINLVGKLVHTLGLDKDVDPLKNEAPKGVAGTAPGVIVAIGAALAEHRKKERDHE
jgi:oxaloacetate decarboxylase gamma subunit